MANSTVLYEVKDQIAYVTLNRPEKLNCVNLDLIIELGDAWERFEKDPKARVAILSGAGRAFCAGIDLTLSPAKLQANQALYYRATQANGLTVLKPVVGAIHGYALGSGWALATRSCDITVAAEGTQFGYPEPIRGRGRVIDFVAYLPFKISLEVFMTGQWLSAERAAEFGLVNKVVPEAELMKEAVKYAEVLMGNAPLALRAIKYGQYKINETTELRAWREFEQFGRPILESEDMEEGSRAFQEKRKPQFKGK